MTLLDALHTCDMLLIDGLHCFDFTLDDAGLRAECMDGRQLRRWQFSAEQLAAAQGQGDQWRVSAVETEHLLICMSALRAPEDEEDDDEPHLQAPAKD
ncbi:DUF5629 family protein [Pseudomonas cremoricolorata]|uniref:DUF5629 family protein n=1 Tax=Pseudomonas cremoricolorata TaxID=157783 RepID=UPI0003F9308C|nr:DUF5629 family protein [Pseudomonas cremoricolorata]